MSVTLEPPRLSTSTPEQQLESKLAKEIQFRDESLRNLQIKFSYDKTAGDFVTIKVFNAATDQEISYKIDGAAAQHKEIISLFIALQGAEAGAKLGKFPALAAREIEENIQKLISDIPSRFTGSSVGVASIIPSGKRPEAFQTLQDAIRASDPSLHGFSLEDADPTKMDLAGHIKDIRRGAIRTVLSKGNVELELNLGTKKEITVRVLNGKDGQPAVFGIELDDKGPHAKEIVETVKALLPMIEGKDAKALFQPSGTPPVIDPFMAKMFDLGKLSRLENVELKGAKWGKEKVADGLEISNVSLDNCTVVFAFQGRGYIKGLTTQPDPKSPGKTHLLLHAPGAILDGCVFNEGTVLTQDPVQKISGLNGAVLLNNTKLLCNAIHCDLRNLTFMESIEKGPGEANWDNFKGLLYNKKQIAEGLAWMGRNVEPSVLHEELTKLNSALLPATIEQELKALLPTAVTETKADPTTGKIFITMRDAENYRCVTAEVNPGVLDDKEDPKNRIKMNLKYFNQDTGERSTAYATADGFAAVAAAYCWLSYQARKAEEPVDTGIAQISKTHRPTKETSSALETKAREDAYLAEGERKAVAKEISEYLDKLDPRVSTEIYKFCRAEVPFTKLSKDAKEQVQLLQSHPPYAELIEGLRVAHGAKPKGESSKGGSRPPKRKVGE